MMAREITLTEFIDRFENGDIRILDVREAWETPFIRGENVISIPMNQLPQAINMIPRTDDLIVICQHAIRSKRVIEYLESQHGFDNLVNLQGGVSTYAI
ncbi:MAG: sulfurtransferase [Candidatus Marinimicrobia bacterium]|jgi:rhodanese-related sulfurtransferase|nr:sulfurtransferase [Candidatus Neomarinimicrobiota bacterium]MBT4361396.1 sulfurtransferase [Candidatus Neomarinimicrobiota bacterium]MBT4713176.1 sulfurtransferase [Candidatus Neomarinimicrobiota bacterium]MBT4947505.1 sulfurtransferase [Candidatus Neomarinimicrobiota bacterium]MBT5313543.1 sulfurtransferase [Candidatus Neomarinimicrobiota bacterium]